MLSWKDSTLDLLYQAECERAGLPLKQVARSQDVWQSLFIAIFLQMFFYLPSLAYLFSTYQLY
jgi:hypothetical protein